MILVYEPKYIRMHVPLYISSCIHSYLIALTLSCAPRLRGRLLVFDYLTCPPLLEMSTTDVGLSKSPRFPRYRGTLFLVYSSATTIRSATTMCTYMYTHVYLYIPELPCEVGALLIQYLSHSTISAEELVKRILDTS